MDDALKLLLAVACVAMIAFVGRYFWVDYQMSQRAEAEYVYRRCLNVVEALRLHDFSSDSEIMSKALARQCVRDGVLPAGSIADLKLFSSWSATAI